MKKKAIIFARSFTWFYEGIRSDIFDPYFVVMTKNEKSYLEDRGHKVYGCFEEEYDSLEIAQFDGDYLVTSLSTDRFLHRFSYEKRCEILGKEITFWREIYAATQPDIVISETIAIEITEVMSIEAKRVNIPHYTQDFGFLPHTFYWKPDPFSSRMEDMSNYEPTEEEYEKARNYIHNVKNKHIQPVYVHTALKESYYSLRKLLNCIWREIYYRLARLKNYKQLKGFHYESYGTQSSYYIYNYFRYYIYKYYYDSLDSIENKKIVFYPMHMEPEAILNYYVEENYSQDHVISCILSSLRTDQFLVVKEHPQYPGSLLEERYRKLKKKNCNLIFLPSSVSSFEVLRRCQVITTLTSTAAWEGLILGKPVLVIGKVHYDQCKGATRINDFKQLKRILRNESFELPEDTSTLKYAASMVHHLTGGYPDPSQQYNTIREYTRSIESIFINE